jgi:peptidoglycan/LPS O-acetylase OafA/YrhL
LLASGAPQLAWQAVFSFYVLSGFLMTLTLNESYGFDVTGAFRFLVNRWLRLFPTYYFVVGMTALYIALIGPLNQLNGAMTLPAKASAIIANLSIIGLAGFDPSQVPSQRLSPTTWSLAIELFCYLLLAVYAARSPRRLACMLAIGIAVTGFQLAGTFEKPNYGFQYHYSVMQAGLIPFALGGLGYFFRHARIFAFSQTKLWTLGLLFCANVALGQWSAFYKFVDGLYIAALLNFFLVPMLFRRHEATSAWQKILGGLSYPIFLSHWAIGTLIVVLMPNIVPRSFSHYIITTGASILFCLGLYYGIDQPIQRLRTSIKSHALWPVPAI